MSSTWVAEFDNEKDYDHFVARYKEIAPNGGNIITPDLPENPEHVRMRGAWVDLEGTVYDHDKYDVETDTLPEKDGAWAISFDIAIWDNWTKDFILCIMQEMCKRYSFVEIGCDSVLLVSAESFLKWRCFTTEKLTFEGWRQEYAKDEQKMLSQGVTLEKIDEAEKEVSATEKKFRDAAQRFFDGDASDLILSEEGEPQSDFWATIKRT